jgi:dihydroorotate dehydrogenase (NAD+) catalytic subunit
VAGVTRTLAVDLGGGLVIPTPVMIAAGCGGTGKELAGLVDMHKVGALVTRTITYRPQKGSPPPRIAETASGIVWSTGGQNPGIDAFVTEELGRSPRPAAPLIVSLGGGSSDEFVRSASMLQGRTEIAAIEVNLSAPDDELGRPELGLHIDRAAEVSGTVARLSTVPVFAKLPLHATDIVELARAVIRSGVHGLTIGGSPPGVAVSAKRLRPSLGPVVGWMSGPALKPMMLRAVFEVSRVFPDTPILAVGGVWSGTDAIECLLAGAWAVQVGTATLVDPGAPVAVAQGVARYLKEKGLSSPADVRGRLRVPASFGALEATDV